MATDVQGYHIGGINKDIPIERINSAEDYLDALDILRVSDGENGVLRFENMRGTQLEFDLPTIVPQAKKYFIKYLTRDVVGEKTAVFKLQTPYGDFSIDYTFSTSGVLDCSILSSLLNSLNQLVINGVDNNFIDNPEIICPTDSFNLETVNDLGDYVLSTVSTDYFQINVIQEYIPNSPEYVGKLVPIGYCKVNDVGYVFSCIALNEIDGYGEIGVVQYNPITDSYSYTTLLGSVKFKFSLTYPIRSSIVPNGDIEGGVFVDDHNIDRWFEFNNKNGYVTNGALVLNGGFYDYDTLGTELILEKGIPTFIISYVSQADTGGNLLAGSYYYLGRLVTSTNAKTGWSSVTNPIPVTKFSLIGSSMDFAGTGGSTETDLQTSKAINIQISNVSTDFTFLELARVSFIGGAFVVKQIASIPISNSVINYTDTGFDNQATALTLSEINVLATDTILHSRDCTYLRNRFIRANFTIRSYDDYKDLISITVFDTYVNLLNGQGDGAYSNNTNDFPTPEESEYQSAFNVNNYMGYHSGDRIYLGIRVYFNDGSISKVIPQLEATFDQVTDLTDNFIPGNIGIIRTVAGSCNVNINPLLLPDITAYELMRSRDIISEVLFTGMCIVSVDNTTAINQINRVVRIPELGIGGTLNKKIVYFYCPDLLLGESYTFLNGDKLRVYTVPERVYEQVTFTIGANDFGFVEYNGYNHNVSYIDYDINNSTTLNTFEQKIFNTLTVKNTWPVTGGEFNCENCYLLGLDTDVEPAPYTGLVDTYNYYCEIIRPTSQTFSVPESIEYKSLGNIKLVNNNLNYTNEFYGGNIFTQKFYLKNVVGYTVLFGTDELYQTGFSFYSRNRYNTNYKHYILPLINNGQMFPVVYNDNGAIDNTYSGRVGTWLFRKGSSDQKHYNLDYSPTLPIQVAVANGINNSNLSNRYQTGIAWGQASITAGNNSLARVFLPLDRKYEDSNNGAITSLWVIGGELFTMQVFSFRKQYFLSNSEQVNTNESTVFVGTGSILEQRSTEVTKFGCEMTFAPFLGVSGNGDDILYWINAKSKKVVYFSPQNGSRVISDIGNFDRFIQNNLRYLFGDNPWLNNGVCGVFENDIKDAIFTVRAIPTGADWQSDKNYKVGDIVRSAGISPLNYELGTFHYYVAITVGTNHYPLSNPNYWSPFTVEQSNFYTMDYSDVLPVNRLVTFRTAKPYFYMRFNNNILCAESNMTSDTASSIYRMRKDNYSQFFESQNANAFVEFVINKPLEVTKTPLGLMLDTVDIPLVTEISNSRQTTNIQIAEFLDRREDQFVSSVFNDTTGGADKFTNENKLQSLYFKIKFSFANTYNAINTFALTYFLKSRKFNK